MPTGSPPKNLKQRANGEPIRRASIYAMRISFDIDDTLILYDDPNPEPNRVPWLFRIFYNERLRQGTVELLREIETEGWEIYIYTTSYRSAGYIRSLFRFYGVRITDVINQARHNEVFAGHRGHELPSKYPSRWRIDLHVDDCQNLAKAAERFGFTVLRIDPDDRDWTDKVREAARRLHTEKEG